MFHALLDNVFQSTLPRRERPYKPDQYSKVVQFQSTLPRRERLTCVAVVTLPRSFQSTLPRRERQRGMEDAAMQTGFNPRSHEGSDIVAGTVSLGVYVSIHAPTKGATYIFLTVDCNHACFNPRSHEGSDSKPTDVMQQAMDVSIHAPTKGATLFTSVNCNEIIVSIHAPTKGATLRLYLLSPRQAVSIHAPTKGATQTAIQHVFESMVSIHAPTKGATFRDKVRKTHGETFQSTLPRRERRGASWHDLLLLPVSIHAPTKGATQH